MSSDVCASAVDFKQAEIYYPEIRPGYVGWANLFQFGNGELGIAFQEIRQEKNPNAESISLEFFETAGFPYSFSGVIMPWTTPDKVCEYVHLKSSDNGETWTQTGRCAVRKRHYWYAGFPDGRMVRFSGAGIVSAEENTGITVEESRDGGSSWTRISFFMEECWSHMFKFRKLSDGRLVAAGGILPSWGPGGKVPKRWGMVPGQILPCASGFFASEDEGHTWSGPHYVFPGLTSNEFDFVELPGGDLLFIGSTIQTGRPVRQTVRRTSTGYFNDPMMSINRGAPQTREGWEGQQGIVPEAVTITKDGLLIGALRCKPYTCSNDLGENWYEIEGAPDSLYQPMCDMLPDGRFITVGHYMGDPAFGEYDMYIGTHTFRVDASAIPEPTRLDFKRDLSEDGNQYVNQFSATLTSDGTPVAGQRIELRVKQTWLPDRRHNTQDITESDDVRIAVTDEHGRACFRLTDKDRIPHIHDGYQVMANFTPSAGSPYAACRGAECKCQPMTPVRNRPGHLPVFMLHSDIVITPQTAEQFPDLKDVIARLDPNAPDVALKTWIEIAGSETRGRQILDLLERHHIVERGDDGVYRWYRWVVREGLPIVGEVRVSDSFDHCV